MRGLPRRRREGRRPGGRPRPPQAIPGQARAEGSSRAMRELPRRRRPHEAVEPEPACRPARGIPHQRPREGARQRRRDGRHMRELSRRSRSPRGHGRAVSRLSDAHRRDVQWMSRRLRSDGRAQTSIGRLREIPPKRPLRDPDEEGRPDGPHLQLVPRQSRRRPPAGGLCGQCLRNVPRGSSRTSSRRARTKPRLPRWDCPGA